MRVVSFIGFVCLGILIGMPGCGGERDVPIVIDADEIAAYVEYSPEAKEIFRVEGLFPTAAYEVPHQEAVYRDVIVSHKRTIEIAMVPLKNPVTGQPTAEERLYADYGSLGRLREAWATVKDEFEIETTRMYAGDTLVDTTDRRFNRFGFFLKLGDDSQDFVGWILYGFNGVGVLSPPLSVVVRGKQDGVDTTFSGNLILYRNTSRTIAAAAIGVEDYIKLSEIVRIDKSDSLAIGTEWGGSASISKRDYPLLSLDGTTGYATSTLAPIYPNPRDKYGGIVDLRNGTTKRYDLVFMQSLHDDEFFPTGAWCIPYRLF